MEPKTRRSGIRSLGKIISGLLKRALDVVAALLGLILLSPALVLIALLIKRDTPGPVFYWGRRMGRRGRHFKMLKFRTMYEEPRSYHGPRIACQDDDRITPVGRWLRDTKLNEVPQLWNVLVGQMSLVGPRPEDPALAKTWPLNMTREILSVRPGITSPASILYRDEASMLQAGEVMRRYLHELSPDKMRLDQLYVRYRSFWLDLDVLFWTFILLVPRIKGYSPPEQLLFVGPVTRLVERYVGWFLWDFLVVLVSTAVTGVVVRLFGPLDLGWFRASEMALGYAILFAIMGMPLKTTNVRWPKATSWEAGRLVASWFLATAIALGSTYYLGLASLRVSGLLLAASVLSLSGFTFGRYRGRLIGALLSHFRQWGASTGAARERVIIVGSGRTAEHIAWLMDHPTYAGKFQIVGFIEDDLRSQGMKIYGSEVIGRIQDIQKIAKEKDVGLIILADGQIATQKFKEFREIARFNPARVVVAPDIFGSLGGLSSASRGNGAAPNLDAYQCLHCLARYSAHRVPPARAAQKKAV